MTTLFSTVTLELSRLLQYCRDGTASALGTATTLIDTTRMEGDDFWNGGTLWVRTGTNNTGKSRAITDWTQSSGTFEFPTMTTVCAAGDTYTVSDKKFPRDALMRAVNQALREIGNVDQEDVSQTTVGNQETYTLPAGVYNVKKIEIATAKAAPYGWVPWIGMWREISSGIIRFDASRQPGDTGYTMRLTYEAPLAELDDDSDTISSYIHLERLLREAAVQALMWKSITDEGQSKFWEGELGKAIAFREQARREHPVRSAPDTSKLHMNL